MERIVRIEPRSARVGRSPHRPRAPGATEFAVAAERIGVASLWVPEVWGYDALTGPAFLAARTTLLAKLDGDYGAQLTALERLIAIVGDRRRGTSAVKSPPLGCIGTPQRGVNC